MSGGRQQSKVLGRLSLATITEVSALTDAVVCYRGADGAMKSNVPPVEERHDCLPDVWPDHNYGSSADMSASILLEFLINHRQITDDEAIADLLRELVPEFTAEFLDVMPDQGGIIPISVINEWLNRVLPPSAVCLQVVTGPFPDEDQLDWDDWPDISVVPFAQYGFVCSRNDDESALYNIRQRISLRPGLQMDWRGSKLVCLTLAANVIDEFLWTCCAGKGVEFQLQAHIEDLYESFTGDFVRTMPVEGGQIPNSVMRNWLFRNS